MRTDHTIALAVAYLGANVGKPWAKGALGPAAYSCWGWARAIERDVFGHDLPIVNVDEDDHRAVARAIHAHPIKSVWRQHAMPQHGDLVELARHDHPTHVGVFLNIDRGGISHSVKGGGVRFDALQTLPALGWYNFHYFRPQAAA